MPTSIIARAALAAGALAVTACAGDAFSTSDPALSISGYTSWYQIDTWGRLPGHGGDTYRAIYANDVARTFEGGQYPEGAVIVKEVHDLAGTDTAPAPGALQYVAVMRRIGPAPTGLTDEGGWMFTYLATPTSAETHYSYCWDACHVNAPFHGAFLDYSK